MSAKHSGAKPISSRLAFSERLEDAIARYHAKANAEMSQELIQIAKDVGVAK
ncbi:MAG TPA: hypothetical protein VLT92_00765 [Burkholderiales bacterium]|nr:hypothetical protein [Burkholderiales bacterium]